jgi:hypothetical protein
VLITVCVTGINHSPWKAIKDETKIKVEAERDGIVSLLCLCLLNYNQKEYIYNFADTDFRINSNELWCIETVALCDD